MRAFSSRSFVSLLEGATSSNMLDNILQRYVFHILFRFGLLEKLKPGEYNLVLGCPKEFSKWLVNGLFNYLYMGYEFGL